MVRIQIKANFLLVLIWVQTVCKGDQQLATNSLKCTFDNLHIENLHTKLFCALFLASSKIFHFHMKCMLSYSVNPLYSEKPKTSTFANSEELHVDENMGESFQDFEADIPQKVSLNSCIREIITASLSYFQSV